MADECLLSCAKCGNQVATGTRFCAYCGNPLKDSVVPQKPSSGGQNYDDNQQETLLRLKAKDIMSRSVIPVYEEDSLLEAARLMMLFRISGLPVVSKSNRLVGVVTATDLFFTMGRMSEEGLRQPLFPNVRSIMTRDVHTITADTDFSEILRLMIVGNIHTLPVMENDVMLGVIGRRDVIYYFYRG
jgi:CBS-domain-containing membrane protein